MALLVRARFPRPLASVVVCTFALAFLYVIGMGAYTQFFSIYADLPRYGERIGAIVDGIQQRVANLEDQTYRLVVPERQRRNWRSRSRRSRRRTLPGANRPTRPADTVPRRE